MAKKNKDWSQDRAGAFAHVFLNQVPDHVRDPMNTGKNYKRPYNKTKRSKQAASA